MGVRLSALVLLCLFAPTASFAETGILLLANSGSLQWNTQIQEIAAKVGKQKPTELVFETADRDAVRKSVDRLTKRGATEIAAVQLFTDSPQSVVVPLEYLQGFSVPIRTTSAGTDHPMIAEILLSRAMEISRDPAGEVVVLAGYAVSDAERNSRTLVNLAAAGRQLNSTRRFAGVITIVVRADSPTPAELERMQRPLQRIASGRRILVVPVLISSGTSEPHIQAWLQGLPHEIAKTGLLPDARLVDWILSSAAK